MRIALDAMGGDNAPAEIVRGGVQAARDLGIGLVLVGDTPAVEAVLRECDVAGLDVEIVHAADHVRMDEHATDALRSRRESSIVVAARLVKEGRAAALVSAGHTGATLAATLFVWGRVPGVERPALTVMFPTRRGLSLVLDVGANVDARPEYLAQFGLMGSIYAERVLGVRRPRVGLLNIGEEDTKGNRAAIRAHELLRTLPIEFIGNVEGKDLPSGVCDVVVSDGFVGNVALKTAEGVAEYIIDLLREEIGRSLRHKVGALLLRPALRALKRRLDYEEYGGAPLLGVSGIAIVAHGRSRARAIRNAVRLARDAVDADLIGLLRDGLSPAPASGIAMVAEQASEQ